MYTIKKWDAMIDNISNVPKPVIYFEPDLKLLEHARLNNYQFPIQISSTGSNYDNNTYWGILDKSSKIPNCRPNFFNATNLYALTLLSPWFGLPNKSGSFSLNNNIIGAEAVRQEFNMKPIPTANYINSDYDQPTDRSTTRYIIHTIISIGAIVFLIYLAMKISQEDNKNLINPRRDM